MMWGVDEIVCVPMGMLVMTKASRQEAFFLEEGKRTKCGLHIPPEGHTAETVWHTTTDKQTNERNKQI